MIKKILISTVAASAILMSSSTAFADAKDDKIIRLEEQMKALMAKVEELTKNQDSMKQDYSKQMSAGSGVSGVKFSMKPSPKIESADGKYSFQPFGRAHVDYTAFDDDLHDHPDNSDWRRARFGFKGKLGKNLKYKYEMDLADQSVAFKSIFLKYTGFDLFDLKVGHFKPFQGLDKLNSSNYFSLIERASAMDIFASGETTGLAIQSHGDNWGAHLGVFGEPAGSTSDDDDEDVSLSARVTAAPFNEKGKTLHLGFSARLDTDRNDSGKKYSARGETGDGDKLISTGTISNVDDVKIYGLELAGVLGGFHAQAEYLTMDVSRNNGATDADFSGWYTQAGYILTGETRPYKVSSGTFGRIKPNNPFDIDNGGWGAFEVVARYSSTDLNDTGASILGGELDVITGGINWYINNNVRVMANYRQAESDQNGVVPNDKPKSFTLRTQFDF